MYNLTDEDINNTLSFIINHNNNDINFIILITHSF
jgi:hypothetical protein